jgi:hypothetical protein
MEPLQAQIRLVHFFDTPDLTFNTPTAWWCAPAGSSSAVTTPS